MNYNEFFDNLALTNSRNDKISLLSSKKDDLLMKKICELSLSPMIQFYQRKIPDYVKMYWSGSLDLKSAVEGLSILSSRTLTGNAAIAQLQMILSNLSSADALVIERIIQKDLKCGVSTSTVNKVWKDLIPEYPCMLCSAYDEKLVSKIKYPAFAQIKMDGMRVNAIVKDGTVEFRSRNGKEISLLGNLEQDFIKLAGGANLVFDGELLVRKDGKILDRQTGNGILNKSKKGTISDSEASLVEMTVWDVIPYDKFLTGKCDVPYKDRFDDLFTMTEFNPSPKINVVMTNIVPNLEVARSFFNLMLEEGQEGIILKDADSIWENKRSKGQVKFKAELDVDLVVTGWVEGTGKYEGLLGALQCESADGVIKVNVGSGFIDEDRKTIDQSIIGKIISVKYNARIKNTSGEESLFLPVYLETRLDKTEADLSEAIK